MSKLPVHPPDAATLGAVCRQYHVRELSLFGSQAREEASASSDVDLLVSFEPGSRVTFTTLARLQRALEGLWGKPVDLVPKEGLKAGLKAAVLAEARVLYAA